METLKANKKNLQELIRIISKYGLKAEYDADEILFEAQWLEDAIHNKLEGIIFNEQTEEELTPYQLDVVKTAGEWIEVIIENMNHCI